MTGAGSPRQVPGEGLRPSHRLRQRADYERAYRQGIRATGRFLVVVALPNRRGHARLGISAPRRVGSAVRRNLLRRRLRELFRRDRVLLSRPVDLVVNLKTEAAEATFPALRGDFERACQKVCRRLDVP